MTADFKPEQIRIVSFVTMTSDRNDSVKILNHCDSFLPDISASILKSNYAKLLATSIYDIPSECYLYVKLRIKVFFCILATRTSKARVTKSFGCSSVIIHSLVRRYKQTGISIDTPRSGDVRQHHRENTFNLLSCIYASGSSRQL